MPSSNESFPVVVHLFPVVAHFLRVVAHYLLVYPLRVNGFPCGRALSACGRSLFACVSLQYRRISARSPIFCLCIPYLRISVTILDQMSQIRRKIGFDFFETLEVHNTRYEM